MGNHTKKENPEKAVKFTGCYRGNRRGLKRNCTSEKQNACENWKGVRHGTAFDLTLKMLRPEGKTLEREGFPRQSASRATNEN